MAKPCGILDSSYARDMGVLRTRMQFILLPLLLIGLYFVPKFVPEEYMGTVMLAFIMMITCHGLNIMMGYTGLISIGQGAFMGVGAYFTVLLVNGGLGGNWFFLAIPLAGIGTGIVGMLFGLPSLRVKGFYLAMATLAAQFILYSVFLHGFPDILHGAMGLYVGGYPADPSILPNKGLMLPPEGANWWSPIGAYYIILATLVVMTFFAKNIPRTRVGRAFVAIRDNDLAAEVMGINLLRYKSLSFFVGCFFAGVAGSMIVVYYSCARPDMFTIMDSIWLLGAIVIGGMGRTVGPIFGVIFIKILDEVALGIAPMLSPYLPMQMAVALPTGLALSVFGLAVIIFLIVEPRGFAHTWEVLRDRVRNWPFTTFGAA